ncbi:SDR family NAD(P)-dependent oxidoreductase [Tomitella biformata]|uniref:SDR family NAD(P)-dependent oxidoreductase n=1 Tax=Tomitella biformata TaxID=630403 RepID=UPI000464BCA0|nr:SDR family oxidoreductase [Tomitella biformata]
MGNRLAGKTAIVTGGAGGIGRGIVRAFTKQGANVLFVDINEEAGKALAEEVGDQARFISLDISQQENAAKIVAAAVEAFGRLDVLVNNAHASRQAPFVETTQEHMDLSMNTGFYATFWLMQAAYPQLKANEGAVINFASGSGLRGMPTQTSYAAAKEAIRGISRVAANEWAVDNINVNIISPLAATEGVQKYIEANPETGAQMLANVPLHRYGDPEKDIAPVAVFLASEDGNYLTGQTIMADGGSIMMR